MSNLKRVDPVAVAQATLRNRDLIRSELAKADTAGDKAGVRSLTKTLRQTDKLIRDYGLDRFAPRKADQ